MGSKGTVRWFCNAKGYGFITPEDGGDDIFAHHSEIAAEGYKTLKTGLTVSYQLKQAEKGCQALNIVPESRKVKHKQLLSQQQKKTDS